jgi:Family of unknown function (DUF6519)/Right handed beta helix region
VSFDNSRFTFDPWKNYSGVVMEQGRVQLDADWNEWLAEVSRRIQAGTLDIMGHAAYPPTTPAAFLITATSGALNDVTIGCGRMYVDGLLAENHGLPANASWDPALAELSGSPQPPNLADPNPNPIDFTLQPNLPGVVAPTDTGSYLAYLDVWTRAVTYLEDAHLVDIAVGVDTTGRLQTVWQVKLMANTGDWTCATPDSEIPYPASSAGQLTTNVQPNPTAGPCCLTDGTGYTGVENQFYRVEIHQAGQGSDTPNRNGATFKWSRDNASVETAVTAIQTVQNSIGNTASQLTVTSLGRDQVLGFKNGDWVELLDDWSELWDNPGVLCQIDSVNVPTSSITLTATVDTTAAAPGPGVAANFPVGSGNLTDPTRHTRIRRWEQSGKVYDSDGNQWCELNSTGGLIPVPATKTLVLENGITVQFGLNPSGGNFNVADFWTFAARTADGSVEKLIAAPPRGIHHHYTKLSIVTFSSPASYTDCRNPWGPSGEENCGCCTCTVGDGVNSFGKYSSIQQAVNSLPATGGEICILPGRYYEYVVLNGLSDVVIHGCGAQTRLASPTMNPGNATGENPAIESAVQAESGFAAILTVAGCQHIDLHSFAVEAADDEVGVLLDSVTEQIEIETFRKRSISQSSFNKDRDFYQYFDAPTNWDVTIHDLALTASTLPAILANNVELLTITDNRVAMNDVSSQWASVYVSGIEIRIEKNWIGLQDAMNAIVAMPSSVVSDISAGFDALAPAIPLANGGIHIAGPSQDVLIVENEIEDGSRNGITLGSFSILDAAGGAPSGLTGLLPNAPNPAATTFTLALPGSVVTGNSKGTIVAGGFLQNIQIARNRIRNMGLCGIGPVGFFNLLETIEVISVQNLTITGNIITGSVRDRVLAPREGTSLFGYGAICVPDVQNLIVRDNTITDFGSVPGAHVCGIFVLNGEQVEISRNQVIETRDWSAIPSSEGSAASGAQAGIGILFVTPPALNQIATASAWASSATGGLSAPIYQPDLPALRIENNVVRVPLGLALEVLGVGPFAIANNHFSSGGTIPVLRDTVGGFTSASGAQETNLDGETTETFLTVLIANLGAAIEVDTPGAKFSNLFNNGSQSSLQVAENALSNSTSGAVHFTNNICQLESRASRIKGMISVAILSLDHLTFANNHCWLDGPLTAALDAFLLAGSLHVTANRFQEAAGSVLISGVTFGLSNITTQNISTYCLLAGGVPALTIKTPNVVFSTALCPDLGK